MADMDLVRVISLDEVSIPDTDQYLLVDSVNGTKKIRATNLLNAALSENIKAALLDCFAHVAWTDNQGQDYYDALEDALYADDILRIEAVFNQDNHTIFLNDPLDSLKSYLTVTAYRVSGTSEVVTDYTLSGTLAEGSSSITVTYANKTDDFTATVTWGYRFKASNGGLLIGGIHPNWYAPPDERTDYFDSTYSTRISEKEFLPWVTGYDCYVEADTQLTVNVSVNVYNQIAMDNVANHQNINLSNISQPGWKSNPSLTVVPDSVNDSPTKAIRVTFKSVPETSFSTPDVISEIRITRRAK